MDNSLDVGRDIHYYISYNMEPLKITKIIRVGASLGIIIPKTILDAVDLKRGDQIFVVVREDMSVQLIKNKIKTISC